MTRLVILGTHSFAVQLAAVLEALPEYQVDGFVENWARERCDLQIEGRPVWWVDQLERLARTHSAVCGLGSTRRRAFVGQAQEAGMRFPAIVHPRAWVGPHVDIGAGTLILAGASIAPYASVGAHVLVNRGVLLGHHTHVEDFVTLSPGANVAGSCHLGQAAFLGLGAIVLPKIVVGSEAVVAAGAVVTRDVAPRTQVHGIPARVVDTDVDGL